MGYFLNLFREYGVDAVMAEGLWGLSQTYKAGSIKCILIFYVSPFYYLYWNIKNILTEENQIHACKLKKKRIKNQTSKWQYKRR